MSEKNAGAANWTYDDAVMAALSCRSEPGYEAAISWSRCAALSDNLPADTRPETDANEYRLVIHATKREESDNGVHYADSEAPADKMTFSPTPTPTAPAAVATAPAARPSR